MTQLQSISGNKVLVNGRLQPATVYIESGKIAKIELGVVDPEATANFGDLCVLPGLVDAHVHLNEPGRTDWEGFETGTKSAAFGGVTTVVDMPLNAIPPTTTVANFETKLSASTGKCWVDVAFWGGLIPSNVDDLVPLLNRGVRGFKCFLIESGVAEFPSVDLKTVETAMRKIQGRSGVLMFHAEIECSHGEHAPKNVDNKSYQSFLDSRPDQWEVDAVSGVIALGRQIPNVNLHIVHLASAEVLPVLSHAIREEDIKITAETCFHYLALASETIPNSTVFKCCPPVRSQANQDKLWQAISDGLITSVVSDHSPCTPDLKLLKDGDFMKAWGGIASVGLGLTLLNTENRGRLTLEQIAQLTSKAPAQLAGLDHLKGEIKVGLDADFCVFDPEAEYVFHDTEMHFKNKLTPYNGRKVKGRVMTTILRGDKVYEFGKAFGGPTGNTITEPR